MGARVMQVHVRWMCGYYCLCFGVVVLWCCGVVYIKSWWCLLYVIGEASRFRWVGRALLRISLDDGLWMGAGLIRTDDMSNWISLESGLVLKAMGWCINVVCDSSVYNELLLTHEPAYPLFLWSYLIISCLYW